MEVYGVRPMDSGAIYGTNQVAGQGADQSAKPDGRQSQGQVDEALQGHKELSREDASEATDEMNSIVQALNTDIQFKLHDKTKQLMVQVVQIKDGKVLKEFPPHELLDVMAKIREYVGSLLDKKV